MDMKPAGYGFLVHHFGLRTLEPLRSSWIHSRSARVTQQVDGVREDLYPPGYDPGDAWTGHLEFALKHEGVDLPVLAALSAVIGDADMMAFVRRAPTGRYARIAWFLHEWMTGRTLPLDDLKQGNYVPVLNEDAYHVLHGEGRNQNVQRQRVVNNLPGVPEYCPMLRRTPELDGFEALHLDREAAAQLRRYPEELLARVLRYLYVKETKSSFEIERLTPDSRRSARFVELLRRAGEGDCFSEAALVRLQRSIVDERYAAERYRSIQNYIGQSLGPSREVIHFVPPRPDDLRRLMEGWEAASHRMLEGRMHPVVTAAAVGFGFVFLHPFDDGNGRIHRFLLQHVLAAMGFTPAGMLFPLSATILRNLRAYDETLERYARRVLPLLSYTLDRDGAMRVTNDSAFLYRFPDLTSQAEALFAFIRETVQRDLPAELEYLATFDNARSQLRRVVDMPERRMDLFLRLCLQGKGRLSLKKRTMFAEITDAELARLERIVRRALDATNHLPVSESQTAKSTEERAAL